MAVLESSSTILSSPFFVSGVLPFLLVFVLVYAVLQKSKILGDNAKQMNALIALAIGLIVVSFSHYTNIIVRLVPILAVGLVIILVFLMLWGFVFVGDDFKVPPWVRWVFAGLAFLAVLISVLIITGAWDYFRSYWSGSEFFSNVMFIVIVVVAIAVVLGLGGGKPAGGSSGKS